MSGTTVSGKTTVGISLTIAGSNPLYITDTAYVSNTNAPAVSGAAGIAWTITNAGTVQSNGTSAASNGISLANTGTVTNSTSASISGYDYGVTIGGTTTSLIGKPSLANSGTITAHGTRGIGVSLLGGYSHNFATGTISGTYVGLFLTARGSADNAGLIETPAGVADPNYGLAILGAGSVINEVGGTIASDNVGIILIGTGTVINSGSVASRTAYDFAKPNGARAAVDLYGGGSVTNTSGAHISSQWIGVQIGHRSASVGGTVDNQGTIFASDGTNGAAVWVHGPGVVINASTGAIEGGPYGIVAYYDTTVVNSGTIGGTEFSVFQSNNTASNLVEVTPGATFTGVVLGGAELSGSVTAATQGTLELQAGTSTGTIDGFAGRFTSGQGNYLSNTAKYFNFSNVVLDDGAAWSLGGTVSAGQTLDFAGRGLMTLANPTEMQGTIDGFVAGDTLELAGITGVTSAVIDGSEQIVVSTASGPTVTLQLDPTRHDVAGTPVVFGTIGGNTDLVACFAEGTRIATDRGEMAVESLLQGMRVRSPFGGSHEIVWTGHRRTDCRRHPRPHDVQPVRVQAGAFGPALPARDLWLSPDHAVFVAGVLIPVRYLTNGRSIAQMDVGHVTYWHVELSHHDILLAEGLACETYLDTGNRGAFANGGAATTLHPDFALQIWRAQACAELVRDGARLTQARANLLARAAELGHYLTDDPDLTLSVGQLCQTMPRRAARPRVQVSAGPVRLSSRVWVPAQTRADATDGRVLGVAVAELCLDGLPIPLDDTRLSTGWHAPEPGWRWTMGDAVLQLDRAGLLTFTLAVPGTYWRDRTDAVRLAG